MAQEETTHVPETAAPPEGQQVEGLPFGGLRLPHPSSLSEFIEWVFFMGSL